MTEFGAEMPSLCQVRRLGAVAAVSGEVDIGNVAVVTSQVRAAVRDGATELDLTGVRFSAAAGMDVLVAAAVAARAAGGWLTVRCSPQVARLLWLCEWHEVDRARLVVAEPAREPRR